MPIVPPVLRASTRDLPDVPPLIQYLLGAWLPAILAWVEATLMRTVLLRCADHPLLQLAQHYDPAAVVAACAHYYHAVGTKGTPPTFSVALLVRAEIVRAWADSCSDPELEWLLASNLLVRWYVGLPLLGCTPDHTTLHRFHAWLTIHHPDALFRDVLAVLDYLDPEDPTCTPQIVDTFAMASPAAPAQSVAQLLRHLTLRLIRVWQDAAPAALQYALPPLDLGPLVYSTRWRTPAERLAQLQQAVSVAEWVSLGLTPHLPTLAPPLQALVHDYLLTLRKVIADETITDAAGWVQLRPPDHKGHYRCMSAIDRQATFRKHEGSPAVFGTNAVVATTATRIRAVIALTGSTPDSVAPAAVIRQQQAAAQPLPSLLVMDQAGGHGSTRAQLDALSDGQTQLVALIPAAGGADPSRFGPAAFRVDGAQRWCRCPAGVISTRVYAKGDGEGIYFRFLAAQCRDCPFWDACRGANSNPRGHRVVYVSPYHGYLRAAEQFNASAGGQALLRQRWKVEPTIAWLVRYHGCRRARRVGLAAAQCQLFQACAVRNLLLWLNRRAARWRVGRAVAEPG